MSFQLAITSSPKGDQKSAIAELGRGLMDGEKHQVLLGVTGSGKTFTMAKLIEKIGRPALVLAHNKTLAAQLYHEFKTFFPGNAVEYFVSYYDYYQPEAYIPSSGVYIEKEATINDELDRLRLSATKSLFERRDCIIVASVSCIYGLGSPEAYYGMLLMLEKGQHITRKEITSKLVEILYDRNDGDFRRGTFRVRGDVIEIFPTYDESDYRIELWGDEVETLSADRSASRPGQTDLSAPADLSQDALRDVEPDERSRDRFDQSGTRAVASATGSAGQTDRSAKAASAHHVRSRNDEGDRILPRDRELFAALFGQAAGRERRPRCSITCRTIPSASPPSTRAIRPSRNVPGCLSVATGRGNKYSCRTVSGCPAYAGQSAVDAFEEFEHRVNQVVYVSATPGPYELTKSAGVVVEQIIRPTGLVDPEIEIRPIKGQVDDLLNEIRKRTANDQRVLVTTLTKRMAEDLAEYYSEVGVKCNYLHSEVSTLDRMRILRDLRQQESMTF